MNADSLEQRTAAIARAMAIHLNDPWRADLARLAGAHELHRATRRRIALLVRYRDAVRAGRRLDALEWHLVEVTADSLEGLLAMRPALPARPGPASAARA